MNTYAEQHKSTSATNQPTVGTNLADPEVDPQFEGDFSFEAENPESPAHLRDMTTTFAVQNRTSANLDSDIHRIIEQITSHQVDDELGRWQIVGMLINAKIPEYVARRFTPTNMHQLRDDLAAEIVSVLQQKALSNDTMDLALIGRGVGSPSAWARGLATSLVRSKLRNIRNRSGHEYHVDPTIAAGGVDEDQYVDRATLAYMQASVEDNLDVEQEREVEAIEEDFADAAAGLRPSGFLRVSAKALIKTFKIPDLVRPLNTLERETIRCEIADDPGLARRTVEALLLPESKLTAEQQKISARMYALFVAFNREQLETLATKPAEVAHHLVQAAVSPLPRPSRDELALTLRTIRMADTGPEWRALAKDLLTSWIANEAEAVSEFNTKRPDEDPAAAQDRLDAALAWPERVAAVLALPSKPLGKDEREVSEFIASVVDSIRGMD